MTLTGHRIYSNFRPCLVALMIMLMAMQQCVLHCQASSAEFDVDRLVNEQTAARERENELVMHINKKDWSRTVLDNPVFLVYFSALWCGYCRQLTPEYYKAAAILANEGIGTKLAIIEVSDSNRDLFAKFKITRYPTIMLVENGGPSTVYRGEYTAISISRFVKASLDNNVANIFTMEDLQNFLTAARENSLYDDDAKCVVALDLSIEADGTPRNPKTTFLEASEARPAGGGYGPFALALGPGAADLFHTLLSEHIETKGYVDDSGFFVAIFSLSDLEPYPIEIGKLRPRSTSEDFLRYLDSFHLPVILKYHESNLKRIQYFARDVQVLVFSPSTGDTNAYTQQWPAWLPTESIDQPAWATDLNSWDKAGDLFLGVVSQIADTYRGRALFIHVPEVEYHIYQLFHVSRKEGFSPEIIVVDLRNEGQMQRYQFTTYDQWGYSIDKAMLQISDGITANLDMQKELSLMSKKTQVDEFRKSVSDFMTSFFDDGLEPTLVSEDVIENDIAVSATPEDITKAKKEVVKLVGENFESIVADDDIDLYMVAFIAPWCGHCKGLEPILDTLATYYHSSSDNDGTSGLIYTPTVRVGRIDATKNEVSYPGVKIFGYPTIYFFKKLSHCPDGEAESNNRECSPEDHTSSKKIAVEYGGQRTVKAIKSAIRNDLSA